MSIQPGSVPPPNGQLPPPPPGYSQQAYPPQPYPPQPYPSQSHQQVQAYGGHPPYARNDEVLVAVTGSVFPQICPRCGQRGTQQKTVKLQYIPPWARAFGGVLSVIVAKRATVQPWFCAACLATVKKNQILGGVLLTVTLLLIVMVGFSGWFALAGILLLIPTIVVLRKASALKVKLMTKDTITLKDTHPAFRAALPIAP